MFSTKCIHCKQLINLKTEEVRQAVEQAESAHQTHYEMPCPKCRKPVKIQVRELRRKLPPTPAPATEPTTSEAETGEESKAS